MDPSWFEPINAYCERHDTSFWSEPLNALSNAGFLVAAALAARRERESPLRDRAAQVLAVLVAVVGIGSFLFHTFANRWSLLADVIPIAIFIYSYFCLALHRYFGLRRSLAFAATLLFAVVSFGFVPALDALTGSSLFDLSNGSIGYLPALLALVGTGAGLLYLARESGEAYRAAGAAILGIAALFLVSLGFRTLDSAFCSVLPVGTHMFWHLLNAGVLYALIVVALRFRTATVPFTRS